MMVCDEMEETMSNVRRIYVEKKAEFAVQAKEMLQEARNYLGMKNLQKVRILIRYDIENISEEIFHRSCNGIFAELPVDDFYLEEFPYDTKEDTFSVEYLTGQFDQRADSAVQCIQFLKEDEQPIIRTATTYVLEGELTKDEIEVFKAHCINPVDSREASIQKPDTLKQQIEEPKAIEILEGFLELAEEELETLYSSLNLAMTLKDFVHIQNYFKEEKRNPSMTEIRVLDTYWSDHCRHTTFLTQLKDVAFEDGIYQEAMEASYKKYLTAHSTIFKGREDKFICLMDLALMAMRELKREGRLDDQEETEEINACSIVVPVEVDGIEEEWLVNFKNETHNHPTEIEPFGGAATCLGGAIRDPLSGRTYVYQAMRVTGAADPTVDVKNTLKGKLPQKKIVTAAAHGYSSYGNQIGLATGLVKEIYHPNYVAKRMEIGAVLGAAPRRAVKRETSDPKDVIILLGGRTGRDGCGGATGSSKVHTEESIETCGAEVQKGNPLTERKIQRLFRREEVSKLIKKCNDFGAGGVSVAIGELADGLQINLDMVPKKYEGLDGTEIAISESQERMAVVIAPADVAQFLKYAKEENLEAVEVAVVTEEPRLVLMWRGEVIVNLSRKFLDTNGAKQETDVFVNAPDETKNFFQKKEVQNVTKTWLALLKDLNVCSQKGLVERFDSSIGANSVLMPYGGRYQMTETQSMVAKLPVLTGKCDTVSMMSYGFDPYLSSWSPYHGAIYAVLESIAKIVATGGDYKKIRFTFQEYFKRMSENASSWGQPFSALLGAYDAQMGFSLPSIGGKDSMSGTFQDIEVPPTLVSFAVDIATTKDIVTPELKQAGNALIWIPIQKNALDVPVYEQVKAQYERTTRAMREKMIVSAYALDRHGIAAGVSKMAFGNRLGVRFAKNVDGADLFAPAFGDLIAEVAKNCLDELQVEYKIIGEVIKEEAFLYKGERISLKEAQGAWEETLETVFATVSGEEAHTFQIETTPYQAKDIYVCNHKVAQPTVFIPVFAGTNCEYDSKRAFEEAGAKVVTKVFRNLTAEDIRDSVQVFEREIAKSQIIMFPGGFSAGDEPDGSAKFFATAFQNEKLKESVMNLLNNRDGLVLGICNGFQTLVKLGLLPYGEIKGQQKDSPTLTYNTIGRHISRMVHTKVLSNKSAWLQMVELGSVYTNPASHGEGRFVANEEWLQRLFENGQVATGYVNPAGARASLGSDDLWNPNGSYMAIEGITSPDGRILGKMAHSERKGAAVAMNIYGEQNMHIFESGIAYFK